MYRIESKIEINARIEKAWQVLMDFEAYPSWNPFIQEIERKKNRSLMVKLVQGNNKPMVFKPRIIQEKKEEIFSWQGKLFLKGLFDGHHSFKLQKIEANKTLFVHSEEFKGILVPLLKKSLQTNTTSAFNAMNKAIKKQCEQV